MLNTNANPIPNPIPNPQSSQGQLACHSILFRSCTFFFASLSLAS